MSYKKVYAYFGHHKCASTWIHSIIEKCCSFMKLKYEYLHSPRQFNNDLEKHIEQNNIDFFTYANADYRYIKSINNIKLKGFHVVRDPRDVAVSAYFSHRNSHPTHDWPKLELHQKRLREIEKDKGLLLDLQFSKGIYYHMSSWNYSDPNVKECKMEDITQNPLKSFINIFEFLGLKDKMPSGKLEKILYRKRFSTISGGRKPGEEKINSHYRKGTPGDWLNHFKEEHTNYFNKHYGNLIAKLGYEK